MTTALFVRGGWAGHEPQQTSDRWAHVLRGHGFEVTISDTLDSYLDADLLARTDLVVQTWTQGVATPEQIRGLSTAVESGTGLAGWHGGVTDSFRESVDYQIIAGGQWVAHPDNITPHRVDPVPGTTDPVMAGIASFDVVTEQYYVHVDPSNTVLATTTFDHPTVRPWVHGITMPVVWKRHWGLGRVFVSLLGHVDTDFEVPQTAAITERGLLWAAGA